MMCFSLAYADEKTSTGFYWPLKTDNYENGDGYWLGSGRGSSGFHIGEDMWIDENNNGEKVHAIDKNMLYC